LIEEIILEQEAFLGLVIITPCETAGTKSLEEAVLPFVRAHVLVKNHGVAGWADIVTHGLLYRGLRDLLCTLRLASQLGKSIRRIPLKKIVELLNNRNRLGLPGPRSQNLEQSCAASPFRANKWKAFLIARPRASKVQRDEAFESLVIQFTDEGIQLAPGKEE
jgi:hypothetical protein